MKKSRIEKLGINCEGFGKDFFNLAKCRACASQKPMGNKKCGIATYPDPDPDKEEVVKNLTTKERETK